MSGSGHRQEEKRVEHQSIDLDHCPGKLSRYQVKGDRVKVGLSAKFHNVLSLFGITIIPEIEG